MRKTCLMLAIIILVAGVSAQAQKGNRLQPIIPPVKKTLTVQDQSGGGFVTFNLVTGEFKCTMCEYKITFSGPGQVKVDGFNVYLSAVTDSYQIFVTVNMWDRQGKAVMEVFQPDGKTDLETIQEFWTDLNIDNNTLNCSDIRPAQ